MKHINLLAFAAAALPTAAFSTDFAEGDGAAEAVVAATFAEMIAESSGAGAQTVILTARADLNGDGIEDILGGPRSGYICGGAGGCPIGVFLADGRGGFTYVAFVFTELLDVLDTATNGMRDLSLASLSGSGTFVWTGTEYAMR